MPFHILVQKIPTPRLKGRGHWQDPGGCPSTPGCFIIIHCSQLRRVFEVALGPLLLHHLGLQSPWAQQLRQLSCSLAHGTLVPWPGTRLESPALEDGFLTTGPPGKLPPELPDPGCVSLALSWEGFYGTKMQKDSSLGHLPSLHFLRSLCIRLYPEGHFLLIILLDFFPPNPLL